MALPGLLEARELLEARDTRRVLAAVASGALHLGIFLAAVVFGGRHDGVGETERVASQLVFIEAPDVDRSEGLELAPLEPSFAAELLAEQLGQDSEPPSPLEVAEASTEPVQPQPVLTELPADSSATASILETVEPAPTYAASKEELATLPERLARLIEQQAGNPDSQLQWEDNGKQYTARLVWERAKDGTALEHVIAQISASDQGKLLSTRIMLKRLAFSQFTQVVDRWDPMVQLHDDVIVGRFHSNSQFNVMHDSRVGPKFLGKVTTAARSFEMFSSGRGRQAEIFPGGLETRTSRIDLPKAVQPSAWAPEDPNSRIHELSSDTRIRFFADGSYMWRTNGAPGAGYLNSPSEHPVYFIATPGTTLAVQGVVAGKILVYSPHRIVIEDDIVYARDPRIVTDSRDYLGMVSDKYVEVASPGTTGPGDLNVHAAIFAGRRFVVRDIDHGRSATLRIYGSLSAGSLSASEPRYATEIEYDPRFEKRRPPGFPFTSRFEAETWDGQWVATSERMAEETF
ncbi:hypothetical protein JM946_07920 [Steroidobacter sp. S1-65]|uniref:Uncharacterized protein n=1 Tax=Steroidobacter gossypii TaxID=2805490 RepID=A0ABS1WUN2_9GAMM|nr:hypothetical protein [Steroidobacter gossypii]MBM0104669.1 hypothetical protein [Steroidobacter gossypii]